MSETRKILRLCHDKLEKDELKLTHVTCSTQLMHIRLNFSNYLMFFDTLYQNENFTLFYKTSAQIYPLPNVYIKWSHFH